MAPAKSKEGVSDATLEVHGAGYACRLLFRLTEATAKYACAVAEVFECTAVAGCQRVSARQANLPPMVTLNVKEKKLFSGLAFAYPLPAP